MARKKVKLVFIQNDSARRATFKKRRRGIMKKVRELSTLCGVSACAIVYGPYESEPEVWPSLPEAKRVVSRFKSLPDMEQCKKMMNQEEFLMQRIAKLREQLKKQVKENQEKENTKLLFQCMSGEKDLNDLTLENLGDLVWLVDGRMKAIRDRIQLLARSPPPVPHLPPHPHPHPHPQYMMNMPTTTMDICDQRITRNNNNTPAAAAAAAMRDQVNSGGGDRMAAMEAVHAGHPSWFMDMNMNMNMMNHNENMGFPATNEVVMPSYMDNNTWTNNPFFS
ncbi:agamous-like MADS-box protein AGL80 [Telopea speciosissima]|uniref:agamous-like MADS-box protein AGL80 n=1 Tax=Telopea speciosissima TaxID=54955 RepID=UPI001CC63A01|nr:agamous-like MADS-box protein AGL80 [Telopea speciosissima]